MTKKALLLLADGFEEIEAVVPIDILRRAGIDLTVASVSPSTTVVGRSRISIVADKTLAALSVDAFDALVLPGGSEGAKTLASNPAVQELIKKYAAGNKTIGVICAATLAVRAAEAYKGRKVTSYPGVKEQVQDIYAYQETSTVVDGPLISSRGPGTAIEFALALVEHLVGRSKRDEVAKAVLF